MFIVNFGARRGVLFSEEFVLLKRAIFLAVGSLQTRPLPKVWYVKKIIFAPIEDRVLFSL